MALDRVDAAVALATASLTTQLFGVQLPPLTTVRRETDYGGHQAHSLMIAACAAAAFVAVAALATRSRAVAVIGGCLVAVETIAYSSAVRASP